MKKPVISACNISIGYRKSTYGNDQILYSDLSFNLFSGELTCLLGQNGAGKSTLLRTLAGMQSTLSGDILLENKKLSEYTDSDLAYKIGLVLTDKTSIGGFKVSQIVALGRYPYTGFWGKLNAYDKETVKSSMNDVGIYHKADSYMAELSDGERQKVMIAKALAQECPIVFLDEPTAFLDITSRIEIMNLLHNLSTINNKSVLLSTHDIELALLLADRLWLLSPHGGLKCGVTEDIVLDRSMECFLSKDNICFDIDSGSFLPQRKFSRFIYVDKKTKHYRWIKNFLERNSWGIVNDNDTIKTDKEVTITDNGTINLIYSNSIINFSSFEELDRWLKDKS